MKPDLPATSARIDRRQSCDAGLDLSLRESIDSRADVFWSRRLPWYYCIPAVTAVLMLVLGLCDFSRQTPSVDDADLDAVLTPDDVCSDEAELLQPLDRPVWESPTHGPPLDLAYLPAGVQAYIALRPAEILQHPEGTKTLAALGPLGELVTTTLRSLTGLQPDEIDRAIFGLMDSGGGNPPATALVIHSIHPIAFQNRPPEVGHLFAETVDGVTVYRSRQWTFYLPPAEDSHVLVAVPFGESDRQEIAAWLHDTHSHSVSFPQIELLRRSSDADRQLTLLCLPDFFMNDGGKTFFTGPIVRMKAPLTAFLSDRGGRLPRAALFSAHLTDVDLFLEFRALGAAGEEPLLLAGAYRDRVVNFDNMFGDYLNRLNPYDYGQRLLRRFPRMLELLGSHTVAAADDKQAVIRCYLPAVAAHNLALATQLAVQEVPDEELEGEVRPAGSDAPVTLADKLNRRVTLASPVRRTLDAWVQLLGEEIGVPVEFVSGDLFAEGINKIHEFQLNEHDQPAHLILRKILDQAYPRDRLVYVVHSERNRETLRITTRAGAARRGERLTPDQQLQK